MTRKVGVWIDHRKAVIVILTDQGQEIQQIQSSVGKRVRFAAGGHARTIHGRQESTEEDRRDRDYIEHLNRYYHEVIACIGEAEGILILGPGEAKGELQKHLESKGLGPHIVGVEAVDKMTDRQVAARVREQFGS